MGWEREKTYTFVVMQSQTQSKEVDKKQAYVKFLHTIKALIGNEQKYYFICDSVKSYIIALSKGMRSNPRQVILGYISHSCP